MSEPVKENEPAKNAQNTSVSGGLLPYSGGAISNPAFKENVPLAVSNACNIDRSGEVTYRYNSLGFRGEEFDENAKFRIFVCGPSEGFGLGLNEKDMWCYQFKLNFAKAYGVEPEEVNLLNFSQIGASMDYISRVTISQCQKVKPALVLCALAPSSRTEYFTDEENMFHSGKSITFNPRMLDLLEDPDKNDFRRARLSVVNDEEQEELLDAIESFYSYYTEQNGLINRLKNVILVQQYCDAHKIPCLFWSLHRFNLKTELAKDLPESIRGMADCIDFSRIYTHAILDPEHPKAADRIHPGPDVNKNVGDNLWRLFYERILKANAETTGVQQ